MPNKNTLLMETSADGTAGISFHATDEHGPFAKMEEIKDNEKQGFTKDDFEQALEKTSRKIKK